MKQPTYIAARAIAAAAAAALATGSALAAAADDYNAFKTAIGAGAVEVTWDGFVGQGPAPSYDPFVSYAATDLNPSLSFKLDDVSNYAVSSVNFGFPGEFSAFSGSNTFAPIGRSSFTMTFAGGMGVTRFGVMFSDVEKADTTYVRGFDSQGNVLATSYAPLGPATQTTESLGNNSGFSFASISNSTLMTKIEINLGNCWVAGPYSFGSAGPATGCPREIVGGAYVYDGAIMDNMVFSTPVPEPGALLLAAAGLGIVGGAARRRRLHA